MYPFGGLPENVASFCSLLRREYGFHIGAGELLDAARALHIVDLTDQQSVRAVLRAVLTGTYEDAVAFDAAFDRFFLSPLAPREHERASRLQAELDSIAAETEDVHRRRQGTAAPAEGADGVSGEGIGLPVSLETNEDEKAGTDALRASYSPVSAESSEVPEVPEIDEAWRAAARTFVRRVEFGVSRKWRAAVRGRRFDFRRTLRSSLQTGGEPLTPRWLARSEHQPRFIVVIDGSRSMSQHAGTALRMATALARVTTRVEIFTFSTELERATNAVRGAGQRPVRLPRLEHAWGGGTNIGACLADLVRRFGDRLLTTSAVVIVVSDGLDVGEPQTLRTSVKALRRRSGALVWLNPLLDTPGYEPTALGMSIARPFITTFSCVNDLAGFIRLSRTVRLRS